MSCLEPQTIAVLVGFDWHVGKQADGQAGVPLRCDLLPVVRSGEVERDELWRGVGLPYKGHQ